MNYFKYKLYDSPVGTIGPAALLSDTSITGIMSGSWYYGCDINTGASSLSNYAAVQVSESEFLLASGDIFGSKVAGGYYDEATSLTYDISDSARNQWTGTYVLLNANGAPDDYPFTIADITGTQHLTTVGEAKRIIIALGNYYYSIWTTKASPISGSI